MTERRGQFVRAAIREAGFAVLWWVLALTVLFVLVERLPGSFVAPFLHPTTGPEEIERLERQFAVGEPVWRRWLAWVWNVTTLEFGHSSYLGEPVRAMLLPRLGRSLLLLATTGLVAVVLVTPVLGRLARGSGEVGSRTIELAYVASSLPPLLLFFGLQSIVISVWGSGLIWPGGALGSASPGMQALVMLSMATVLAVPFVGMAIRRLQLWRRARRSTCPDATVEFGPLGVPKARGDALRLGSTELWLYVTFLIGMLVVVESLFDYPGIGPMWLFGLVNDDHGIVIGATSLLLLVAVALGYLRNLAWVAGGIWREPPSPDPAIGGAGDANAAADGGGVSPPDGRALWAAVRRNRKARVGGAGFLLLLVGGVVGSRVLAPEPSPIAACETRECLAETPAYRYGLGPGTLVNSWDPLLVVTVVAVVVAILASLLLGVVAGRYGGRVATALRVPFDVLMMAPLLLVLGVWVGLYGFTYSTTRTAVFGGLVLAPYAFRAARVEAADRFGTADDLDLRDVLPAAAARSVAYVGTYAAFVAYVFVAYIVLIITRIALIPITAVASSNITPDAPIPSAHVLYNLQTFDLFGLDGTPALALVLTAATVALPAACLHLFADGVRETTIRLGTET